MSHAGLACWLHAASWQACCLALPCLDPLGPAPACLPAFGLQILLVIAVWLALWLLRPYSLSPHFEHRRLRLHGQLSMLFKQRHHWMLAVTTTTLDTASVGYCLSIVWFVDVSGCLEAGSLWGAAEWAGPDSVSPSALAGTHLLWLICRSLAPRIPSC